MLLPIAKIATSVATGVLALFSARNVVQTRRAVSELEGTVALGLQLQDNLASLVLQSPPSSKLDNDILAELQKMSRKEVLALFLSCPSVDIEVMEGEWNAYLLENNGPVMTTVASFMTHQLFGRGSKFLGKKFDVESKSGINCFEGKEDTHPFDFGVETSKLLGGNVEEEALSGKSCIVLNYTQHQSPLSPWKTMRDELRFVPLPKSPTSDQVEVMVGLGGLGWSAGVFNGTPFCLVRRIS